MAFYIVVHHRRAKEQPWSNAWFDDERLRAITTTTEIGRRCAEAARDGAEVFVHRCAYGDPSIACAAKVRRVEALSKNEAFVEFADARAIGSPPLLHPVEGQNSYDAPPPQRRD
jgi:hypothetical protein